MTSCSVLSPEPGGALPIEEYWAKTTEDRLPGISTFAHGHNVAAVTRALYRLQRAPFVAESLAVWMAGCHDVGKIAPGFLAKCAPWLARHGLLVAAEQWFRRKVEKDHSKISQFTLQHLIREKFSLSREDSAIWAAVVGMHHGAPHWRGEWMTSVAGISPTDVWERLRRQVAMRYAEELGAPSLPPLIASPYAAALWWTAGLISVADWIGSDETLFSAAWSSEVPDPPETFSKALAAVASLGFLEPESCLGEHLSFQDLFGFAPNELQQAAVEVICEPGVYVIEAPMGMGKTEAALAAAHQLIRQGKASGLYFALPTQATSNRIHERVSAFLGQRGGSAPRLIHSGSWLLDERLRAPLLTAGQPGDQKWAARDWFASSKRALLAPYGVGTVDQALMAVIAVKHFFVRHFALAGKVVVIDEVHSYDVYTGTLVEALIHALEQLGCTVIILSATLTRHRRESLLRRAGTERVTHGSAKMERSSTSEPFPLITGRNREIELVPRPVPAPDDKIPVNLSFRPEQDILEAAVEAARAGACVLWICNTVDRAQSTFRAISAERREGDPSIGLLHSRFPFFRRQELEAHWMAALGKDRKTRPQGSILVSTQIVEQSVDLDADLLVTELAPTDMLFQRMGRLWRHPVPLPLRPLPEPEMWIIQEEAGLTELEHATDTKWLIGALGKKAKVYSPYVLLRTLELWGQHDKVRLPFDIRPWLEATYEERQEDGRPAWASLKMQLEKERASHLGRAEVMQNVWNLQELKDDEGVGTRLNECPNLPLVLATGFDRERLILMDGSTIPIFHSRFRYDTAKALHRNLVKAPLWWFTERKALLSHVGSEVSQMIALHLKGQVEVAVVEDGAINLQSLGEGIGLNFDLTRGLTRAQKATPSAISNRWMEDDDESYD